MQRISIIIPTYNEADTIGILVKFLLENSDSTNVEVLISDGGSMDGTMEIAAKAGAVTFLSPHKSRAAQMNYGASKAIGDVLYFVHADSLPPANFIKDITKAIEEGFEIGRYRTKFNSNKWLLKLNAFFTRFDWFICYGGDQTLFMSQKLFNAIGGFNDKMLLMEDYEIVVRARKRARYKILTNTALLSARKYEANSWLKVQKANSIMVRMYKNGASQQEMVDAYKQMLVYR